MAEELQHIFKDLVPNIATGNADCSETGLVMYKMANNQAGWNEDTAHIFPLLWRIKKYLVLH